MIRGQVYARPDMPRTGKPQVTVFIADSSGVLHPFEFTVDTGYNLHLTLPAAAIERLGLPYLDRGRAVLADNENKEFEVYSAAVSWQGRSVRALVFQSESQPLLGMAMLWGSRLTIDARAGGEVIIEDIHAST